MHLKVLCKHKISGIADIFAEYSFKDWNHFYTQDGQPLLENESLCLLACKKHFMIKSCFLKTFGL